MVSFGSQKQKSTPRDIQAPEFKELREPFSAVLAQFFPQLAQLFQGTPTQQATAATQGAAGLAAPVSGQQQSVIDQIVAAAGGGPTQAAAQNLLQQTLGGQFLPGQQGQNPFLQALFEAAARPVRAEFEDVIVPGLLSRFTQRGQEVQGQGSSAFALQANRAAEAQGRTISDLAANIFGPAFEAERQRQTAAITQASQLSTEQVNRLMQGLQAASLPQLTADLGIQRGLEAFQQRTNALLAALQTLAGVTQPVGAQKTSGSGLNLGLQF